MGHRHAEARRGQRRLGPNWSRHGFTDQSVRQVVRVTTGGSALRIRLSNAYGSTPLRITAVTVGRSAGDAQVWPGTARELTFDGSQGTSIAPGRDAVSDAQALSISPLEKLTVTLYFADPTGPATFHRFTTATSYRALGRRLADTGDAFTASTSAWYFLGGVEVSGAASPRRGTVVAFGDSLMDGTGATPGADKRFTDKLAERLVAARRPLGIVNTGIGGNRILNDSPCYYGDKATVRFRRDVLDRPA
ncbi:hypothetical protein OOK36_54600 [Streptomyces sp. NBC_00365]|uniref:SGNH/GDSL hydrolase family protein n=1 Tax=Streptomyces sp. NBC_00365 TaxID=2975726 RepID=UPI00225A3885|nr:SGNH/GDSL hydrolase family protein [Streptomyces sp. NBC_00365]MCX5097503.1 hypothetical protein [Streptomyces sp. NBC_00365]